MIPRYGRFSFHKVDSGNACICNNRMIMIPKMMSFGFIYELIWPPLHLIVCIVDYGRCRYLKNKSQAHLILEKGAILPWLGIRNTLLRSRFFDHATTYN